MRLGVTLRPGDEVELAAAAESVGVPFVHVAAAAGTEAAIAAAVVGATTSVRVIVGISVGDEHPVTLAEEIAVLDNLSNGRIGVIAELAVLPAPTTPPRTFLCCDRHGRDGRSLTEGGGGRFRQDSLGTSLRRR